MVVINWISQKIASLPQSLKTAGFYNSKRKNLLIKEQRALADYFYRCSARYTAQLEKLMDKIGELQEHDQALYSGLSKKQRELFIACLRLEASLKTNAELARERKEWERRLPAESTLYDAFHPLVRLEIIESELKIRNQKLISPTAQASSQQEQNPNLASGTLSAKPQKSKQVNTQSAPKTRLVHAETHEHHMRDLPDEYLIKQAESVLLEISSESTSSFNPAEHMEKASELRDLHKKIKKMNSHYARKNYRARLRERMSRLFGSY